MGHRITSSVHSDLRLISTAGGGDLCLLLTKSINKLLTKIKTKFTESEQQLFVASFYGFLKYDPNNDFVIDLDDVWKWMGFAQKVKATVLLEKHFIIDKDYKKSLYQPGKQSDHTRGGHNKEIMLISRH